MRLNLSSLTPTIRFLIGGNGPLNTNKDRALGVAIIFGLGGIAVSLCLQMVAALLWALVWVIQFSLTPIEAGGDGFKAIAIFVSIIMGILLTIIAAKVITDLIVPHVKKR